jgi:hypothetical protein
MPQLLLETPGHSWYRVPTENPRHRRPYSGAFIFGVSVTSEVFSSAPCNVQEVCQCVDRCGGARVVSCFGLAGGCGRDGIPPLRPVQESVKMTRTAVGSHHPRPGRRAQRV